MSYYECTGTVTDAGAGALQCSTGWQLVSEPTFQLVTREQAVELILAVVLLVALWKTFGIILSVMGVRTS